MGSDIVNMKKLPEENTQIPRRKKNLLMSRGRNPRKKQHENNKQKMQVSDIKNAIYHHYSVGTERGMSKRF